MGTLHGLNDDTNWEKFTLSLITAALVVYDQDDEMTPQEIAESAIKHTRALMEVAKEAFADDTGEL